ncbi:Fluoride export protein 1 [Erysiphe neolycopersici]|uniref:Fluoride export protein 1 n=1 Tax=Erysiphe neolycopersici TaxID=212602 RepID=A0A420HUH5_9PEZI|nr:Fluoride export protein 1 [Erysiphe neolycopersici]
MSQNNVGTVSQIATIHSEEIDEISRPLTHLYTIAFLINFAILGTLARLGIQLLTSYYNAPIIFSSIWFNLIGCFIMGFLVEDCVIFNYGRWTSHYHQKIVELQHIGSANSEMMHSSMETAKKSYQTKKRSSPLYLGLTTGFCGSFTSFSSFIRDTFLAIVNLLPKNYNYIGDDSLNLPSTNNAGDSLMAVTAVIILTMSTCASAWLFGVHLAHILNQSKPRFSIRFSHWLVCATTIFLALCSWVTITFCTIFLHFWHSKSALNPPGSLLFSLAFAPLGCLCRFYTSQLLNNIFDTFPLGTFASNMFGTIVLGISYDLQRIPVGGAVACQVLRGIQDGFCGCLTTVSSWIAELFSLKVKHAYFYCMLSILACLCTLIVINGGMFWTRGFAEPLCSQ